jgi:hypothetical protein
VNAQAAQLGEFNQGRCSLSTQVFNPIRAGDQFGSLEIGEAFLFPQTDQLPVSGPECLGEAFADGLHQLSFFVVQPCWHDSSLQVFEDQLFQRQAVTGGFVAKLPFQFWVQVQLEGHGCIVVRVERSHQCNLEV